MKSIAEIRALFDARGNCLYSGESVTQLEHALQSAMLAERAGASIQLITACLLHDLGHMSNDLGETPTLQGVDDKHQYHGVSVLKGMFVDSVLTPIRLHVDAKRYLCSVERAYWESLSADSKRSLELQGGAYSPEAAAAFIIQPFAQDAVNVRRWDDMAKLSDCKTPDLEHYLEFAGRCTA